MFVRACGGEGEEWLLLLFSCCWVVVGEFYASIRDCMSFVRREGLVLCL